MTKLPLLCACVATAVTAAPTLAEPGDVDHPFIMWNAAQVEAIQKRLESDPDAKPQLERMLQSDSGRGNPTLLNLFK